MTKNEGQIKNNKNMPTAKTIKRKFYTKTILKVLLLTGVFVVASTSPYFWPGVLKAYFRNKKYKGSYRNKAQRRNFLSTFSYLKSKGLIEINKTNKQIYIILTEEGKKRAEQFQINDLTIKKPRKWDKKWRVVIFDIKHEHRMKREALRGKLKQLNFYQLQKSVWIYPYSCRGEIDLLRKFFGLDKDELRLITAQKIEDDKGIKEEYGL